MKKATVLIFGMDEIFRAMVTDKLADMGYRIIEAPQELSPKILFQATQADLTIVCSHRKLIGDGVKTVKAIRRLNKTLPLILITKYSSETRAIAALKAGVNDYFKLPFSSQAIVNSVQRLLAQNHYRSEIIGNGAEKSGTLTEKMIGDSKPMKELRAYLLKVAEADSTVLITGETGTGKELAAEMIHYHSPRCRKPFVCVNCAALPDSLVESELFGYERGAFTGAFARRPGKFELARNGTVFLDEIGDMSSHAQAKILRSVENKRIYHLGGKGLIPMDARVIAATNQDPERLLTAGKFREDLYYRLNVARVHVPPLRNRKEDIPKLVSLGIQKLNQKFESNIQGLTEEAMTCLYRYNWPGNVRELLNCIEAAFIAQPLKKMHSIELPRRIQKQLKMEISDSGQERNRILAALMETNWNKSSAAQKLNWSRMTLYRKIEKYNIVEKRLPAR